MAIGGSVFYHNAFTLAFGGSLDLDADVIRMLMVTDTHTENVSDAFVSDLDNELSGGGYARVTITGSSMVDDDANDRSEWTFNDVTFSSLGAAAGTPSAAVAYQQTGGDDTTPANDPLICLWNITNTAPNGNNYVLQVGAEGAVQFS